MSDFEIKEHFAKYALDWTPEAIKEDVTVIYSPFVDDQEVMQKCLQVLSAAEVKRANQFKTEALQHRFIQRRAFRRHFADMSIGALQPLASLTFAETTNGQPFLISAPTHSFSFSSFKDGFIGAHSTSSSIGVDIESMEAPLEIDEMAQEYFSPNEVSIVAKAESPKAQKLAFMKLWCLKEAALKSIGEGLPFGMNEFQFALEPSPNVLAAPASSSTPDQFTTHLISKDALVFGLVLRDIDLD